MVHQSGAQWGTRMMSAALLMCLMLTTPLDVASKQSPAVTITCYKVHIMAFLLASSVCHMSAFSE